MLFFIGTIRGKMDSMLDYTYDLPLVAASVAISFMASFTGLTLTNGISALSENRRKMLVVMASFALGGGIWSMHFVAMLAMRFPVTVYYDALYTLGSVLIAVLLAGTALLLMHFAERTPKTMVAAGGLLGLGIIAMHYLGMTGMRGCLPVFTPFGVILTTGLAIALGIAAIWAGYGHRSKQNILVATVVFALSVVIVHFTAMSFTVFGQVAAIAGFTPALENGTLALIVTLAAFVICGTFLLSAVTFVRPAATGNDAGPVAAETAPAAAETASVRVPYEHENKTYFISSRDIAAVRAEGHYTVLYVREQKLFCPWSISTAEQRLPAPGFQRTHRSYLVNIEHVSGFERRKDNGACLFDGFASLKTVPVSRSRVNPMREILGL
jgi:NO-binding membrane sensor protein with MHYT domain